MTETPIRRVTFVKGGVKLYAVTEHAVSEKPGQKLTRVVHDDGYRELRIERSGKPPVLVNWLASVATYAEDAAPPVKLAKAKAKPE